MGRKLFGFMENRSGILWCTMLLLSAMFFPNILLAGLKGVDCSPLAGVDKRNLGETCPVPDEWAERTQRKSIVNLLVNKTASEKSRIKSAEISKHDFKGVYDNAKYGVKIEIVGSPTPIEVNGQHGIELFARAWQGNQQLGFGADGTVEIERFRIFNPPILVDDQNGDIIRKWTDTDGNLHQRKLREDQLQAIKETLAHTIKQVGKDNNKIVVGKVGNTTSTFYPDAHPESTSHDAMMASYTRSSWATAHDDTEAQYINDNYAGPDRFVYSGKDEASFKIVRFQTLFDTSPIGR